MKTKLTFLTLIFCVFFSVWSSAQAEDNCASSGRTCVEIEDPDNMPSCPSGMNETKSYNCENKGYGLFGAICCESSNSNSEESSDCYRGSVCLGRNEGDSCETSSGSTGACRKMTGSMYSAGGYCACLSSQAVSDSSGSKDVESGGSGCPTIYEAADGTCYQNKDYYCEEVDDEEICGSSANENGKAPASSQSDSGANSGSNSGSSGKSNQTSSTKLGTISFSNPLKYNTLQDFLNNGLSTLRSIIVILSIIFIVLGGVMYILSAGNDDMMKKAKGAITASLIGLAIGIAAPSFLREIYTIFGGKDSNVDTSQLAGPTLTQIAMNFLNFLLSIVGILALIMLIIGGIMYLTSAGDEDRIKSAKKIVTYSIMGIVVSLASLVVVRQIASLLG